MVALPSLATIDGLDQAGPRLCYQAGKWIALCEPDGDAGAGPIWAGAEQMLSDSDGAGASHAAGLGRSRIHD
jgi:hypothetical protein